MNLEMARELLAYNTSANGRMPEAVSRLDAAQFSRELGGGYSVDPGHAHAHPWRSGCGLRVGRISRRCSCSNRRSFPSVRSVEGALAIRAGWPARVRCLACR